LLYRLARLLGVQISPEDAAAAPEPVLAVLRALGVPVETGADVPEAWRKCRQDLWQRCCEPVMVAWEGRPAHLELRLAADRAGDTAECLLEPERGTPRQWTARLGDLPVQGAATVEGVRYLVKRLPLPSDLPGGYHRCMLSIGGRCWTSLVIAAPRRAYLPPAGRARAWGIFLPLYALRTRRSWAAADVTDLAALMRWVRRLGGELVGTLPLLAAYLDEPFDPSPYAPVSRLFWNEFYLDPARAPELGQCPAARELVNSPGFKEETARLREAPLVDYRRGMLLKRRVLQLLARCCAGDPARQAALQRWAEAHPAARDYARFRAAVEQRRAGWTRWPERMRRGELREEDYDPDAEHYHLYVQWLVHDQFRQLAAEARRRGPGLYLDFPLGVHRDGYDTWRWREAFALQAGCGAPPDQLNDQGQFWGFPPLHPEGVRRQGYRYFIDCLRHHLRHAGALRLDHVMSLHRLYWIPEGYAARQGVYVSYRAEEFYAVLCLESHRHRAVLVGEDLGVVPPYVRAAMARHKIYRMYILPFEFREVPRGGLKPVRARALAALNTHDMSPFAAFWRRQGREARRNLVMFLHRRGQLPLPGTGAAPVLRSCLRHLAAGRPRIVLVNLEDLWLETNPQNVPGDAGDYPNWRRKARRDLESFSGMPGILKVLRDIDKLRKRGN